MQPQDQQKARLAGIFDRASATYGQVGAGYFDFFGRRLVELASLTPGMRVLDVACGRGAVFFPVADMVRPAGSIIGIDLSQGMVEAMSADIAARHIPNATAQVMDAERLSFPDAAFDAVTCGFALFFMPDRDGALREFRRVLRDGGSLAISIWSPDTPPTEQARWSWYTQLMRRYVQTLASPGVPSRLAAVSASDSAQGESAVSAMDSPEEIAARMRGAGFSTVAVHRETATFRYRSADEWWQERWSIYFRAALEQLSPEALTEFQEQALAGAREMEARGELVTEQEALLAVAR